MKILMVVKSKKIETLGCMYLSAVIKKTGSHCKIVDISEALSFAKKYRPDCIAYSIMTGDEKKFEKLNSGLKKIMPLISIVGGAGPDFLS